MYRKKDAEIKERGNNEEKTFANAKLDIF